MSISVKNAGLSLRASSLNKRKKKSFVALNVKAKWTESCQYLKNPFYCRMCFPEPGRWDRSQECIEGLAQAWETPSALLPGSASRKETPPFPQKLPGAFLWAPSQAKREAGYLCHSVALLRDRDTSWVEVNFPSAPFNADPRLRILLFLHIR